MKRRTWKGRLLFLGVLGVGSIAAVAADTSPVRWSFIVGTTIVVAQEVVHEVLARLPPKNGPRDQF